MEQGSDENPGKKEIAAAWIAKRPLASVISVGLTAFFLGVGAGASESTDPAVNVQPVRSSALVAAESALEVAEADADSLEEELEQVSEDVEELREERASIRQELSSSGSTLRSVRKQLKNTKKKLAEARQQAAVPVASAAPSSSSTSSCDPNYTGTCVPKVSYDLNCSDISGSVTVVGSDPHGFDGDGDGKGCE